MSVHWGDRRKVEFSPLRRALQRLGACHCDSRFAAGSAAPGVPATPVAAAGPTGDLGRRETESGVRP